ncbi:hypothetical protein BDY19DRAFT_898464 [Irpex rosettiformis]|uniref:Uncharacterized protein n=1 Tax=Irpex rosettiformis TaxID=378272 RepID=A0ACB8TR30_9APHY|nr:hypothetical protein BDY19DRAFT_898464 [Irpex rosettiformis]
MSFVDDTLSVHQLDVICGVYRVLGLDVVAKTAYRSWWPSVHVWKNSGMDIDCWSYHNEQWFKGHLARILSGEFEPMSAGEWRRSLARGSNARGNFDSHLWQLSLALLPSSM